MKTIRFTYYLGSGLSLTLFAAGKDKARAEVYIAVVKKDQVLILFYDAGAMVDKSAKLAERIHKYSGAGKVKSCLFLLQCLFPAYQYR